MQDNKIAKSKLIPRIVYHQTSSECVSKIMEFGFDKSLSGQGCIRRLRVTGSRIRTDKFVEYLETLPENQVINASLKPVSGYKRSGCLLKIKLFEKSRLLDASKVAFLQGGKWLNELAYAREHGYDGVVDGNDVFLFSNKCIERIENTGTIM